MDKITIRACAKINLSLDVTGRRENGYHNIESFMQGVSMYDVVEIALAAETDDDNATCFDAGGIKVKLSMNCEELAPSEDNLAVKGAKAMAGAFGKKGLELPSAVKVSIDKRLPVAAGIAGGSGNAAAVMLGLNALCGNPLALSELMDAGEAVGADLPFSIYMNAAMNREALGGLAGIDEAGVAAVVSGIGEVVEPAEAIERFAVLANPGIAVSTAEVYREIDSLPAEARVPMGLWHNVMEKYTLEAYEGAMELKLAMEALGAEHVLMSGSGPTMVAYYLNEEEAQKGFEKLAAESNARGLDGLWRIWLTETGRELWT